MKHTSSLVEPLKIWDVVEIKGVRCCGSRSLVTAKFLAVNGNERYSFSLRRGFTINVRNCCLFAVYFDQPLAWAGVDYDR